eukprot:2119673-Rhodomonas_salina.3
MSKPRSVVVPNFILSSSSSEEEDEKSDPRPLPLRSPASAAEGNKARGVGKKRVLETSLSDHKRAPSEHERPAKTRAGPSPAHMSTAPPQQSKPKGPSVDDLPTHLRKALMPFQVDGVKFGIAQGGRCIIGDEMGLGKTLQVASLATPMH